MREIEVSTDGVFPSVFFWRARRAGVTARGYAVTPWGAWWAARRVLPDLQRRAEESLPLSSLLAQRERPEDGAAGP